MTLSRRRVVLYFPLRLGPWTEIVRGIYRYADRHAHWIVNLYTEESVRGAVSSGPDGVIAMVRTESAARDLAAWGGPVIDTACEIEDVPFTRVRLDPVKIGRMGAEHLLSLKNRQYAFVGDPESLSGRGTLDGFRRVLRSRGFDCLVAPADVSDGPIHGEQAGAERAVQWVCRLPRPIAVFCWHDAAARRIAEACQRCDRRVPEEIAILGTLNDEFLCTVSQPTLSSVECPLSAVGFQAAKLLDTILSGGSVPRRVQEFAPVGVVARLSTDPTVVADPEVRAAMHFIQEHFTERLNVNHIVSKSGLSRSTLERRFRKLLGHGPLAELHKHRLEQARQLLVQSDQPIKQIARASGFRDVRHLSVMFRRKMGITPTEYRDKNRPS
jgi:LacI family transcriptional regulator